MRLPRTGVLLVFALGFGLVQYVAPSSTLMAIPLGVGELVANVVFFSSGTIAKRNKWLEQMEQIPTRTMWFLRSLAVFIGLAHCGLKVLEFHYPTNTQRYNGEMTEIFLNGLFCVTISIVALDFFRRNFNREGRILKFLAGASYTAYLIHPWVITVVAWSFVKLVAIFGLDTVPVQPASLKFVETSYDPMYGFVLESDGEGLLWLCSFYTYVLSTLIVWPLAAALRKLPGLRSVL